MAHQITSLPPTYTDTHYSIYDSYFKPTSSEFTSSISSNPVVPLIICPYPDFVRVYYDSSLTVTEKLSRKTHRYSFFTDYSISRGSWINPIFTVYKWPEVTYNAYPYIVRLPDFTSLSRTNGRFDGCYANSTLDYTKTLLITRDQYSLFYPYKGLTLDLRSEVSYTLYSILIFIAIVAVAIRLFIYPFWRKIRK